MAPSKTLPTLKIRINPINGNYPTAFIVDHVFMVTSKVIFDFYIWSRKINPQSLEIRIVISVFSIESNNLGVYAICLSM